MKKHNWGMLDAEIRQALKKKVLPQLLRGNESVLADEVSLLRGMTRIDLLLLTSHMHGFEIKSDRDTLDRLDSQIEYYSKVLDKVTLVIGYRHAYRALQIIPEWWGVKLVHRGPRGAILFQDARPSRKNPAQDLRSLSLSLWREEAIELLSLLGQLRGNQSKTVDAMSHIVAETGDMSLVRRYVLKCFRQRIGSKSGQQPTSGGDLHLLEPM